MQVHSRVVLVLGLEVSSMGQEKCVVLEPSILGVKVSWSYFLYNFPIINDSAHVSSQFFSVTYHCVELGGCS